MNLLLLGIISHLMSDFMFQSNKVVNLKIDKNIKGYFIHSLIVFTFTFCLTLFYGINIAFRFALIISISHIVLDYIKGKISICSPKIELATFITDQLLHFLIIFFVWKRFINHLTIPVFTASNSFDSNLFNFDTSIKEVLILVIVYLIVLFAGAVLLEKILNIIDIQIDNQSEGISMGKYIGIIERALILTLVTFGSTSSIGIIFTAKSIARFKKFDDKKHFVEYYLLGTLSSIFIALIGGLFLKNLFN
ncbi:MULTISPECIES: DUF3307 domain-containing protein [unclassified Halanaerobium]|uniref:DUF3307 domain-containing protein n=1 Tax=unclassified Halanaerobium TaxID=2641197 RepID=UPI000DF14608|nr:MULTISPECIES: DUF3307 domain-containing protein [unclassified Halanaerobium]RCW48180.1 uncharacterized protein DUF3307 [Halanaerobium sp. MA284_MarDTE_T2]RCW80438.1 uncharacterized protein DUF3307 [Halanaerobium sp. DL-01]